MGWFKKNLLGGPIFFVCFFSCRLYDWIPEHLFLQNMAYMIMNHLLKAEPTNLQVTYGYSVQMVSVVIIYYTWGSSPVDY